MVHFKIQLVGVTAVMDSEIQLSYVGGGGGGGGGGEGRGVLL